MFISLRNLFLLWAFAWRFGLKCIVFFWFSNWTKLWIVPSIYFGITPSKGYCSGLTSIITVTIQSNDNLQNKTEVISDGADVPTVWWWQPTTSLQSLTPTGVYNESCHSTASRSQQHRQIDQLLKELHDISRNIISCSQLSLSGIILHVDLAEITTQQLFLWLWRGYKIWM